LRELRGETRAPQIFREGEKGDSSRENKGGGGSDDSRRLRKGEIKQTIGGSLLTFRVG